MTHHFPTLAVLSGVALLAVPARGQYAPGMDGRANDANPQVGSGGLNMPVQQGFLNTANLFVTGNVTGGRAFQGFSPIRDSSSLLLGLPSSRLGSFERDSFGLPNVLRGESSAQTNPFFFSANTVARLGAIAAQQNAPGGSTLRNTFVLPQGDALSRYGAPGFVPAASNIDYGYRPPDPTVPNSSIYDAGNTALLRDTDLAERLRLLSETDALRSSPVFGQSRSITQPLPPSAAFLTQTPEDPYALTRGPERGAQIEPFVRPTRTLEAAGFGATSEEMLANATQLLSPTAIAPRLFDATPGAPEGDAVAGRPAPLARDVAALEPAGSFVQTAPAIDRDGLTAAGQPDLSGLAALPGAVEWMLNTQQTPEFAEQLETVPGLRAQYDHAVAIIRDTSERTLTSLAEAADEKVAHYVLKAENELRAGKYYQAASLYRLASAAAPDDALLQLGHAHALLAAGEYLTAVLDISRAVAAYPGFAYLPLNLNAFVGDPKVLDLRRADLERRLEEKDDYRLRFLLGYIEYYTGLEQFGLPNLRKAAAAAPEGSAIARFPEILELDEKLHVRPAAPERR